MKNASYLLIGSGRLARHLEFFITQKAWPLTNWNRKQSISLLPSLIKNSTHVLLAISDSALQGFYEQHLKSSGKKVIHFSGALHFEGAIAAHPLMSFGPHFYSLETYEKMHFVLTGANFIEQVLPGFKNPFTVLAAEDRPLYHALCVLGGNFPVILWNKMTDGLLQLGLPPEAAHIYVEKVAENFVKYGGKALTGPLVRKDLRTIESNLKSLESDPFEWVYRSFLEVHK